jgi:hypothetical protein
MHASVSALSKPELFNLLGQNNGYVGQAFLLLSPKKVKLLSPNYQKILFTFLSQ